MIFLCRLQEADPDCPLRMVRVFFGMSSFRKMEVHTVGIFKIRGRFFLCSGDASLV